MENRGYGASFRVNDYKKRTYFLRSPQSLEAVNSGHWQDRWDSGHLGSDWPESQMDDLILSGGLRFDEFEVPRHLCAHTSGWGHWWDAAHSWVPANLVQKAGRGRKVSIEFIRAMAEYWAREVKRASYYKERFDVRLD